jgi:hypothetical protein
MAATKWVIINYRGVEEWRHTLQVEALRRRMKVQQLIDEALQSWLAGKKPPERIEHSIEAQAFGDDMAELYQRMAAVGSEELATKFGEMARDVVQIVAVAGHQEPPDAPEDDDAGEGARKLAEAISRAENGDHDEQPDSSHASSGRSR